MEQIELLTLSVVKKCRNLDPSPYVMHDSIDAFWNVCENRLFAGVHSSAVVFDYISWQFALEESP